MRLFVTNTSLPIILFLFWKTINQHQTKNQHIRTSQKSLSRVTKVAFLGENLMCLRCKLWGKCVYEMWIANFKNHSSKFFLQRTLDLRPKELRMSFNLKPRVNMNPTTLVCVSMFVCEGSPGLLLPLSSNVFNTNLHSSMSNMSKTFAK